MSVRRPPRLRRSMMPLTRRDFLTLGSCAALTGTSAPCNAGPAGRGPRPPPAPARSPAADYTVRIATGLIELSPRHIVSSTLYNGQFPGPLLRLREGRPVTIDIHNDTEVAELVHWHGQMIPSEVDGAAEEGTPYVPAHGKRLITFVPRPAGLRFYHTHVAAGDDLNRGTYSAQAGLVYIEPTRDPGAYDREVFLVLKEFLPTLSRGGDMPMDTLVGRELPQLRERAAEAAAQSGAHAKGFEVGYSLFAINGRMLGYGEPVRVREGERVLFHVLNASATEIRSLALPGHTFRVVALDGNAVPTPADVPLLWLGTAERISAIVEMRNPGVWVMGDLADDDRGRGMGIVVEYAERRGPPRWIKPKAFRWDYTRFSQPQAPPAAQPDETFEITIVKHNAALNGFNQWTLNGEAFSMQSMKPLYTVRQGHRYRLRFRNASDDIHPLHLHRHSFELTRVGGKSTAGILKDVVMLGGYQELEFDFRADNPGATLFHCHQQLHMDFGFMALFRYA
ncbi:MAG TPA: multicopper oxidase domain-containing protein [Steroidobacteraceae bacterium]|nr:multicopper oxidase domain-containing protein [Steroidobacteraceae bacterium]